MTIVQLCSGLLTRGDALLLTRCVYAGEPEPLWTLPGGRQEEGETKPQTVAREFWEEAALRVRVGELAYASESIDAARGLHVMNATFHVEEIDERAQPRSQDPNVVEVRFVPFEEAPALLRADVLRIPVEAALTGRLNGRYFSFRAEDAVEPFFRARAQEPGTT
ncbi:MAG TPA: NUDIX hydrolase [Candidatus Eremiobacteraceae bacterium]|nr:NUDIX hydrolase [Candidatus Eremiobacteraceae bacterium]